MGTIGRDSEKHVLASTHYVPGACKLDISIIHYRDEEMEDGGCGS